MSIEMMDFAKNIDAEYIGQDGLFYIKSRSDWLYFSMEDYMWIKSIADDEFHKTLEAI
jgi:hypothetical protein